MHATRGPLECGSVIGGYRIDALVSRGGMGFVYRATHVALGRIYALKVLAPELADDEQYRERFRREIRTAALLHHANVVGIHYAGEHEGLLFFVMDFISGTDLHDILASSGALEPNRATVLLAQLASALDAAHARGLVHRDVKPANVLITVRDGEEHAYLTDFGVAKKLDTVTTVDGLTKKGAVVGTVDYMSPEQISGGHTDARTDIYALGCMFFEMLTGRVPYERENSVATLFAHVHEPQPPLTEELIELYPSFGAVVGKAMAKKPEDRYLSAGDFARDAAAALSGSRYTAPPTIVATGEARIDSAEQVAPGAGRPVPGPEPTPWFEAADTSPRATVGDVQTGPAAASSAPTRAERSAVRDGSASPRGADAERPRWGSPAQPGGSAPQRPGAPPPEQTAGRRRWRDRRWAALAAVIPVAGIAVAVIALTSKSSAPAPAFAATVHPVPTNRVTGSGSATVRLQGNVATVTVDTNRLLDASHLMHIHGGTGNCPTAAEARVLNGHRFISANAADPVYGGVVASLTQTGDTRPSVHLVSKLYPATGTIRYKRTFMLGPGVAGEIRQGLAVIVVHGIDYNGNGRYDNSLGPGGEASAPALCGPLEPTQSASAANGGSGTVYVAALGLEGVVPTQRRVDPSFLCHLAGTSQAAPPARTASGARAPA